MEGKGKGKDIAVQAFKGF